MAAAPLSYYEWRRLLQSSIEAGDISGAYDVAEKMVEHAKLGRDDDALHEAWVISRVMAGLPGLKYMITDPPEGLGNSPRDLLYFYAAALGYVRKLSFAASYYANLCAVHGACRMRRFSSARHVLRATADTVLRHPCAADLARSDALLSARLLRRRALPQYCADEFVADFSFIFNAPLPLHRGPRIARSIRALATANRAMPFALRPDTIRPKQIRAASLLRLYIFARCTSNIEPFAQY